MYFNKSIYHASVSLPWKSLSMLAAGGGGVGRI